MAQRMHYLLLESRHRLRELAAHPAFRRLEDLVRQRRQRVDELTASLGERLRARLERARRRYTVVATRLASFDLRARIKALRVRLEQRRGELRMGIERWLVAKRRRLDAICYDSSGRVLRSAEAVALGDEIAVRLARGRLAATVKGKQEA